MDSKIHFNLNYFILFVKKLKFLVYHQTSDILIFVYVFNNLKLLNE
jgi:hypothetical protein